MKLSGTSFTSVLRSEKRDGLLKGVALGARDAHDVALDGGRELEGLGVLDDALNGLAEFLRDAFLHDDGLLEAVAADLFGGLRLIKEAHVDVALGKLADEHVADLTELEVAFGDEVEFEVLLLDRSLGAAEVVAGADFLLGLIDCVAKLDGVGLDFNVKRGHLSLQKCGPRSGRCGIRRFYRIPPRLSRRDGTNHGRGCILRGRGADPAYNQVRTNNKGRLATAVKTP